ncbi:MAG: hypothetical protein WEB06_10625 [Actinomycetota bacterium]
MSEFDELRRLSDADPVQGTAIPSAEDPAPRALKERIVMSEQRTIWLRTRAGALSAAAAVLIVAGGGIVLATRGADTPAPGPGSGPITPGAASCVELYSPETLANRQVAFDGSVKSVSGDEVTFTVGEWFKGGTSEQITLKGASTLGGITSAGPSVSLDPGSRLLVAGDGGFAWGCGFTQPYSQAVATDWRAALD